MQAEAWLASCKYHLKGMVSRGDKALVEATLGAFLLSAEMFLPSADLSVYPTAARPCYPAGSPLSHD